MNEKLVLNLDEFLSNISDKGGDDYSKYVYHFCDGLLKTNNVAELLYGYFQSKNGRKTAAKMLSHIHPDKHESSCLSDEQKAILHAVTGLITSIRQILDHDAKDDAGVLLTQLADLSRKYSAFIVYSDKYVELEEIESYYYVTLYSFGLNLTRQCQEELITAYASLFVFVTHWALVDNILWLDKNLNTFKEHVRLLAEYYSEKPELREVFERFLKIDEVKTQKTAEKQSQQVRHNASSETPDHLDTCSSKVRATTLTDGADLSANGSSIVTTVEDREKAIVCFEESKPSINNQHIRSCIFTGVSIALACSIGAMSWPMLLGYSIFRTMHLGAKIYVDEQYEQARHRQAEYYATMFTMISRQYGELKEHVVSYLAFDKNRTEHLRELSQERLMSNQELQKELCELEAKEYLSPKEQYRYIMFKEALAFSLQTPQGNINNFFKVNELNQTANTFDDFDDDDIESVDGPEYTDQEFEAFMAKLKHV